jgi:flagellar M-ring protein FliF
VVRSESERNATRSGAGPVGGVPGVAANTPPPQAELVDGPPQPAPPATAQATDTESASQRSYELGREVAVTSTRPGGLRRLTVAVAVSDAALKKAAPMTAAQLEALVGAAVGADTARGDMIEVVASKFEPAAALDAPAFYEQPWFAMLVRYGTALIAVLLVLLIAVRPLIGRVKRKDKQASDAAADAAAPLALADADGDGASGAAANVLPAMAAATAMGDLPRQVELARRLATSQPERAAEALQRMLAAPDDITPEASAS